jgi:ABC-type sugar transport system ATPase subunit
MTDAPYLSMQGLSKAYPGVVALRGANLAARRGEAVALMGANGAGKSTLMNILGGVTSPDAGSVMIDGSPVRLRTARDALAHGIAFVHQELAMLPSMTVAENVFADGFPTRFGIVDGSTMHRDAAALLARLGCNLPTDRAVDTLGPGDRQMVEIARALRRAPRIMIFDEPTSSLTNNEKRRLFEIVQGLKRDAVAVIYITHFVDEIFEICDRATVMRNGSTVATRSIAETSPAEIVHLMLGDADSGERLADGASSTGPVLLEVSGLCGGILRDVAFSLRAGEVVGLWGLLGSGRTELMRALIGLDPVDAGRLRWRAADELQPVTPSALHQIAGIVTEDRRGEGLLLPLSTRANLSLASLRSLLTPFGLIDRGREEGLAADLIERLHIMVSGSAQTVGTLSGGNQQKVVVGRWLATKPRLFLLDEPTRGLDVGAKSEILKLTAALARAGAAVLVISSEPEELMRICDRYLVMSRGRITAQMLGSATRAELLGAVSATPMHMSAA